MSVLLSVPCMLVGGLFSLIGFLLWLWVLIDCLTKEPSEGNDKLVWAAVIVFLNGLGALLYYFVRRPERIRLYGR